MSCVSVQLLVVGAVYTIILTSFSCWLNHCETNKTLHSPHIFLILILHVPSWTHGLFNGGAVAKRSTAGTLCWGVIWGLALHSAGFLGAFLFFSATLPSHQICLNVGSNLCDICFISISTESFSCNGACLLLTCPFSLEISCHVVTQEVVFKKMPVCGSVYIYIYIYPFSSRLFSDLLSCTPHRGRVNLLPLCFSILPLAPLTLSQVTKHE